MIKSTDSLLSISIDLKKNRIRIHKNTLHAISNPSHILLLVNPEENSLAILPCQSSEPKSHHIQWAEKKKQKSCEIYSKSLIENLLSICSTWEENKIYFLSGEIISEKGAVRFRMDHPISNNRIELEYNERISNSSAKN
ncbi:hypothetical protein BN3590_02746 [Clostridium sp. C105KSO15]|nr:hypothetical protein BN3590_02746 [Clostridium sp. C105KSO15]